MFENAELEDRVYCIKYGFGEITKIYEDRIDKIGVLFDKGLFFMTFTVDGKERETDLNPILFWDKPKIEVPKKPFDLEKEYRRLERKEFERGEKNFIIYTIRDDGAWCVDYDECNEVLGTMYFEDYESVYDFAILLNENRVTLKELEEVVRKVEREEENAWNEIHIGSNSRKY